MLPHKCVENPVWVWNEVLVLKWRGLSISGSCSVREAWSWSWTGGSVQICSIADSILVCYSEQGDELKSLLSDRSMFLLSPMVRNCVQKKDFANASG